MLSVLFKRKHNGKNGAKAPAANGNSMLDTEYRLYVAGCFREMLYLERRRAERSKKPFLLMLLNMENIHKDDGKMEFTRMITNALSSTTREIDIKGWYKDDRIIGVIFFDMSAKDIDLINEKMLGGFNRHGVLDSPLFDRVRISYHPFPEEPDRDKRDTEFDSDLYPDLRERESANKQSFYLKRAIDIIGSIAAIIIFLPVFIVIPILIKLTSKGPVFFRQRRVGAFGRPFTFLKFRSMRVNNDESIHADYIKKLILEEKAYSDDEDPKTGEKTYKIKNDPRVTRLGRFLRKTSIDEVPQFLNVLMGNMSLVGPRPPIPYEMKNYDLWHLRRVLEFKPGITGLWQVQGRSRTTFNEMVRMDINYINKWSLWLDFKLVVMTPFSLLSSGGAF